MARRQSNNNRASGNPIDSLTALALPRPIRFAVPSVHRVLIEDRRTYHPLGRFRAPRMVTGHPIGRLNVGRAVKRPALLSPNLSFPDPRRTMICIRRAERREVLFAKRKMRSGGGGKRRRSQWSNISCRR